MINEYFVDYHSRADHFVSSRRGEGFMKFIARLIAKLSRSLPKDGSLDAKKEAH